MDVRIVIVNPIYEGNIGSIARVMKNFGFNDLILINPCQIGKFARAMASHAVDVLESAKIETFDDILKNSELIIGTTGIMGTGSYTRNPYPLAKLNEKFNNNIGVASILFGQEDQGLPNKILNKCDMILNIATNPTYPVMNISHAAAVILYNISGLTTKSLSEKMELASHEDLMRLLDHISDVLKDIEFPPHKRRRVLCNLKRICGKSELTPKEVTMLRGILSRIQMSIKNNH
ncbi:MAG TPA: RNA methyltransferase [Candidatus Acidoferrales bacterium]|nr:RNA methyltransferase [Candidatus Acidoferrales bacterium]